MKRTISIFLSFILLASHLNLAIGTHFCGGKAVMSKIVAFHEELSCGMANMDMPECDAENQDLSYTGTPCCENHYHTIQASNDFVNDAPQVVVNVASVVALVYSILDIDLFPETNHLYFTDYSPPPLEKDIQVLFQSFLV